MKTDKHNDWTDAFRESFPQEAQPEAGGWEAVAGRMRRAAARRRAFVAAAALALPLAAGLFLFLPSRPDSRDIVAEAPVQAVVTTAREADTPVTDAVSTVPDAIIPEADRASLLAEAKDSFVGLRPPRNDNESVIPDDSPVIKDTPTVIPDDSFVIPGNPSVIPDTPSVTPTEAKESPVPAPTSTNINTVTAASDAVVPGFDEYPGYASTRHHTVSVGVHAGSTAAGATNSLTTTSMAGAISTKSANNYYFNNTSGTILQHKYVHDLPVTLGLAVRYGLTGRISLESGLDFTRMHSRLDGLHTVMLYAGIPLRINYRLFSTGRVEAYAGLGGKAEKCLRATFGGMKVSEPGLQWSGSTLIGAQARLTRNAWIFVQPDLTYYFTKSTLVSYRSENRIGLTVNAGLRFDLQNDYL